MTRLASSLLPTLGYFSLLLLAGFDLYLDQHALEHLYSNGLGSHRSCISNQHHIPLVHRDPTGSWSSNQKELTRKSDYSSPLH